MSPIPAQALYPPAKYSLAIIIPAYKADHLAAALASIARQSDQRFCVYVGDDASPDPIREIARNCEIPSERMFYYRFDSNLGSHSLVQQWDRCIGRSCEPWVWLFSDDDEMEPDCVAQFYRALAETTEGFDLYRFDTVSIDTNGNCLSLNPPHPRWESARSFAYFLLRGLRFPTQQEIIFKRSVYQENKGIPDFPLAWGSDHAFLISCGTQRGIYTIPFPKVRFRLSGLNISSKRNAALDRKKWEAAMIYAAWLKAFVARTSTEIEQPTDALLLPLVRERFLRSIRQSHRWIRFRDFRRLSDFLKMEFPKSQKSDKFRLLKYNIRLLPILGYEFLARCVSIVKFNKE